MSVGDRALQDVHTESMCTAAGGGAEWDDGAVMHAFQASVRQFRSLANGGEGHLKARGEEAAHESTGSPAEAPWHPAHPRVHGQPALDAGGAPAQPPLVLWDSYTGRPVAPAEQARLERVWAQRGEAPPPTQPRPHPLSQPQPQPHRCDDGAAAWTPVMLQPEQPPTPHSPSNHPPFNSSSGDAHASENFSNSNMRTPVWSRMMSGGLPGGGVMGAGDVPQTEPELANLLMAWYYSGYYTGRYEALRGGQGAAGVAPMPTPTTVAPPPRPPPEL
jgi:hypothetical protein